MRLDLVNFCDLNNYACFETDDTGIQVYKQDGVTVYSSNELRPEQVANFAQLAKADMDYFAEQGADAIIVRGFKPTDADTDTENDT